MGTVKTSRDKWYWEMKHRRRSGVHSPVTSTSDRGIALDSLNYVDKDGKRPGWRYLIATGGSATTQLTGQVRRITKWNSVFSSKLGVANGWQGWLYEDSGLAPPVYLPADPSIGDTLMNSAALAAATDFLEKYRESTNKFSGGAFLAEIGGVVRLLMNPVKTIYVETAKFVGKVGRLRKVHRLDPGSYRAQLSNLWLTYQWGIKPLAADAVGYAIALDQLLGQIDARSTKHIAARNTQRGNSINLVNQSVSGVHTGVQDVSGYTEADCRFYGVVRTAPATVNAAEVFGLDLPGTIEGIWEAIPFTSILDYFTNAGEVLRSLTYSSTNLLWANKAMMITRVVRGSGVRHTAGWGAPSFQATCYGGDYEAVSQLKHRESSGLPVLTFEFKNGLNLPRALNVAALATLIAESRPLS